MSQRGHGVTARRALAVAITAAVALAVTSAAFACTFVNGQTWLTGSGSSPTTIATNTNITAYATGARVTNTSDGSALTYLLVIGHTDDDPNHACMTVDVTVNPNQRTPSGAGFISNTSGSVGANAIGDKELCFRSSNTSQLWATGLISVTIT